jgi:hypothetical protein
LCEFSDVADLFSSALEVEACSFCAPTAEMSLTLSSKPDANVLSLGFAFASFSVSTALSPVSITFSRAIEVAVAFALLAPLGPTPVEGALLFVDAVPFDDAVPLDEEAPLDEEVSIEEPLVLEELLPCDAEPPAEDWALAPTLVFVTL